jgi:hypothetical protein
MKVCGRKPKLSPDMARRVYEWGQFARTQAQLQRRLGIGKTALRAYLAGTHKRRAA